VLLVAADPGFPQKRAITQTKCNFGPNAWSIGYTITLDSELPSGARFFWTEQSDLTAARILESVGRVEAANTQSDRNFFIETLLLKIGKSEGPKIKNAEGQAVEASRLRRRESPRLEFEHNQVPSAVADSDRSDKRSAVMAPVKREMNFESFAKFLS